MVTKRFMFMLPGQKLMIEQKMTMKQRDVTQKPRQRQFFIKNLSV